MIIILISREMSIGFSKKTGIFASFFVCNQSITKIDGKTGKNRRMIGIENLLGGGEKNLWRNF